MTEDPYEWTDPITSEVHRCPPIYFSLMQHVGSGAEHAVHAAALLRKMGLPVKGASERHLRKAVFILQRKGVAIISIRSTRGGYYLARTLEELEQHCTTQERLARSMLSGVKALRGSWGKQLPPGRTFELF